MARLAFRELAKMVPGEAEYAFTVVGHRCRDAVFWRDERSEVGARVRIQLFTMSILAN